MQLLERAREAWNNLFLHKTRSGLAALGIIFGVASVICMLSISEVARRDVIDRIRRMGMRNVVLDSVKPEKVRRKEKQDSSRSSRRSLPPGSDRSSRWTPACTRSGTGSPMWASLSPGT